MNKRIPTKKNSSTIIVEQTAVAAMAELDGPTKLETMPGGGGIRGIVFGSTSGGIDEVISFR